MAEEDLAQIRLGYGFGPGTGRLSRRALFDQLSAPDDAMRRHPPVPLPVVLQRIRAFRAANRARREGEAGAEAQYDTARNALRDAARQTLKVSFARIADAEAPLRERLTWFWADHFTISPQDRNGHAAAGAYIDDAIRPHITGPFSAMLKAVARHPSMLLYLDQHVSVGPGSRVAARTGQGLNENFARELLELHTLGVDGGYTQGDVRAAAELLTGLSLNMRDGFLFRENAAEPGPETVLGQSFGSDGPAQLSDIDDFLEDLAARPETARQLARKLATHFYAEDPPAELTRALETAYRESDGDLGHMTHALTTHPLTARAPLAKAKTPMDIVGSTLVALGVSGADVMGLSPRDLRRYFVQPLTLMGQPFMRPSGPDGWPEASAHWITPQGLAARINFAATVAERAAPENIDPRAFLEQCLGPLASERLRFAVSAAETRMDAIALVLASAEFNRR